MDSPWGGFDSFGLKSDGQKMPSCSLDIKICEGKVFAFQVRVRLRAVTLHVDDAEEIKLEDVEEAPLELEVLDSLEAVLMMIFPPG